MDFRKPKPFHSLKEFLTELVTIIAGILIALSLESAIEAWRTHGLVEHARAAMSAELAVNQRHLQDDIVSAQAAQTGLRTMIAYCQDRLANRPRPLPQNVDLSATLYTLKTAAWDNIVATQVLSHMPYTDAQALTDVYADSATFNGITQKTQDRWFALAAAAGSLATMSDQDIAKTLGDLKVALSYQIAIANAGPALLHDYDEALKILPPPPPVRLSVDSTPIGELMRNKAAHDILVRELPDLMTSMASDKDMSTQAMTMGTSLRAVAPMTSGAINDKKLAVIQKDFDALPEGAR